MPGGIRPDLSQRTLSGRRPLLTKRQKRLNIIHRQTMGAEVKVGSRSLIDKSGLGAEQKDGTRWTHFN